MASQWKMDVKLFSFKLGFLGLLIVCQSLSDFDKWRRVLFVAELIGNKITHPGSSMGKRHSPKSAHHLLSWGSINNGEATDWLTPSSRSNPSFLVNSLKVWKWQNHVYRRVRNKLPLKFKCQIVWAMFVWVTKQRTKESGMEEGRKNYLEPSLEWGKLVKE